MKLEIDNETALKIGLTPENARIYLAVALYKYKGIHGSLAGKIAGKSEFEFHTLLSEMGESVNYGIDDLIDDIKKNDL